VSAVTDHYDREEIMETPELCCTEWVSKRSADAAIAELEEENAELRKQSDILTTARRLEEAERKQAEAELAKVQEWRDGWDGVCKRCPRSRAEADNRILTAELRSYFQQYGWESTESILKYHGAERETT